MSRQKAKVILLCEDRQQETFARRFLCAKGYIHRDIRSKFSPEGKGCGEKYVRDKYPVELQEHRRSNVKLILVVIIDEDGKGTHNRLKQLSKSCDQQGIENRKHGEHIGIFIPTRNIETWLHFLDGNFVDETINYKSRNQKIIGCKPHIRKLLNLCENKLPADTPSSLYAACEEFQRMQS